MVNSHKEDPENNTVKDLAKKYKLDIETTFLILEYFQPFKLKLPKLDEDASDPSLLRLAKQRTERRQKLIEATSGGGKQKSYWNKKS